MGLLTALAQGAAQGLNVLGAGMMRGIEQDREQSIWEKRQALLQQIQRENADYEREAGAKFEDKRFPVKLEQSRQVATQANQVALEGKKAEAGDTTLTADLVARENAILKGTMGSKAQAAGMLARATDLGGGVRALQAELLQMDIKDKKRLGSLYDDYLSITNSDLTDEQKAEKLRPVTNAITALKSKTGQGGPGANPEKDTVKITEEEMLPGGGTRKTERTEVRRPGAGGAADAAPYPDGTELRGKDGKTYVVRGGQPVLKQDAGKPAAAAPSAKPAAADSGDPLAGMSRQEARARRAEYAAELQRWEGKPGAERRVQELRTLIERIDGGAF